MIAMKISLLPNTLPRKRYSEPATKYHAHGLIDWDDFGQLLLLAAIYQ